MTNSPHVKYAALILLLFGGQAMSENIEKIKKLFLDDGQAIDDMYDYTNKKLKNWEIQVMPSFPPNAKILDIGCGMGREAFSLNELGFNVTGIDISERVISEAKQIADANNFDVEFIVSNGIDLPFNDSVFDVVIIWAQTFGLFYGEQNQQCFLNECNRVLKKDGMLSFSGHDREYLNNNYKQFLKGKRFYVYADTDCYWESFTIDEMKYAAANAGFNNIICERGSVYTENDGTILHCECRKQTKEIS